MAASRWTHGLAAPSTGAAPGVAVIGAGLAGLCAAYALSRAGVQAEVFEASTRLGGRCRSDRDTFEGGQIVELGGELLDSDHRHILTLARQLNLTVDDVLAAEDPGTDAWILFDGRRYGISDAARDFEPVLPLLRSQLQAMGEPGYRTATSGARALDAMSVADWIDRHVPGGLASPLGRYLRCALEENFATEAGNLSAITAVDALAASTPDSLDA